MDETGTLDDILDLGSWCILRMASTDTLRVVHSLDSRGFAVWTPIEKRIGRMPKTRARYDRDYALMPSYAFARVEHIDELLRIAMMPSLEHPRFSVFHYRGGIPLVADRDLNPLRDEETRTLTVFNRARRRGMKGPTLAPGSEVRLPGGPFEGLSGIVEGQQGQFTLVNMALFGKLVTIKVASLLLAEDVARDGLPNEATVARAA